MYRSSKKNLMQIIIMCVIIGMAFFPAYLWEQPHLAWVWQLITVWFALACYIPRLRDTWKNWYVILIALIVRWFVIESIGVMTWLPYGQFAYGKALWPTIRTWVPYMLAMTWPPLVLGVWSLIDGQNYTKHARPIVILIGTVTLLAVDLILDPIAVAMQLWTYAHPWWRWWVPLSNFGGRLFSGAVAMTIIYLIMKKTNIQQTSNTHRDIFRYAWGLIYTLVFFVSWYVWRIVL